MSRTVMLVSIGGCPVVFATDDPGSLPAVPGWASAWVLEPFSLAPFGGDDDDTRPRNTFEWTEALDLLSGKLDVSPQSFVLHDAPAAAAPVAGLPVATWLCTRDEDAVPYTVLTQAAEAADTTWHVDAAGSLPAAPFFAWCGQECVRVTAVDVGAGTVTVTRAQLGTRSAPHRWSTTRGANARLYLEFPGVTGRKVILWIYQSDDGTGSPSLRPLWRGWVGADPHVDGATVTLGAEPLVTRLLSTKLGPGFGTLTPFGIEPAQCWLDAHQDYNDLVTHATFDYPDGATAAALFGAATTPYRSFGELLQAIQSRYHFLVTSPRVTLDCSSQLTPVPKLMVWSDGGAELSGVALRVGDKSWQAGDAYRNGNQRRVTLSMPDAPDCMFAVGTRERVVSFWWYSDFPNVGGTIALLASAPASIQPVWTGPYDDNTRVVARMVSVPMDPTTTPSTASLILRPQKPSSVLDRQPRFLSSAVPLGLAHEVVAPDYVSALRGIVALDEYGAQLDPDDWSLADAPVPEGATTAVRWYLTQEKSLGELTEGLQVLYAHALSVVDGRLAIRRIGQPLQHEQGVGTIYRGDVKHGQRPRWQSNRDLVVTAIKATLGDEPIVVQDARAIDDYGPGRDLEVDLSPLDWPASVGSGEDLGNQLYAQLQERTRPAKVATFPLDLSFVRAAIGDRFVLADDWLLPDGLGGRGIAGRVAQVCGKRVNFDQDSVELDLVLFGRALRQGWAAAAKVAASAGATLTLALGYVTDPAAVGGATDFAGSDQPDYPGTSGDGGTYYFHMGDSVHLVRLLDGVSDGPFTVASVDPAARHVVLSGAPAGGTATSILAGDWWDLVPSGYGTESAWQRLFAGIVDRASGVHAGGGAPSRWAP